jgi:hypothetical protein
VSSTTIPAALRRAVGARAGGACEYCLLHEEDAFFPHEPDHVIALKHGGATTVENLALACIECNRFKGSDLASVDPETSLVERIFDPRAEAWDDHFRASDGVIDPLTARARATVALLRMNAPPRVEVRAALSWIGRWPRSGSAR